MVAADHPHELTRVELLMLEIKPQNCESCFKPTGAHEGKRPTFILFNNDRGDTGWFRSTPILRVGG